MTREPFQPVRLYYSIPDRAFVTEKLRGMRCTVDVPAERCWHWLFHGEATSLRFATGYDEVPEEKRPIVIGRIRFPKSGGMTLQTNSVLRAIEGARFFGVRLGPEVVAMRCRVVNRCFAADEGDPDRLLKTLDQNVTVIDPRLAEQEFEREFRGVRTMEHAERVAARSLERRLESGKDVPTVEDYPLAPEEETPEFLHLSTSLQFRFLRAVEHWRGNTHMTLTAIILRTVQEGTRANVAGRNCGSR